MYLWSLNLFQAALNVADQRIVVNFSIPNRICDALKKTDEQPRETRQSRENRRVKELKKSLSLKIHRGP